MRKLTPDEEMFVIITKIGLVFAVICIVLAEWLKRHG